MSPKDLPAISEIGRHIQVEPMCHPETLRSTKNPSLPDVPEPDPVQMASPPEVDPSPTRFSMHDNKYDSDSIH